jgi:hypothetical protein
VNWIALPPPVPSPDVFKDQAALACEIDSGNRLLSKYAGGDYRDENYANFTVDGNPALEPIRAAYASSLASIPAAGRLQGMVDEMATWAGDLHKKYDFTAPSADSGSPPAPTVFPGALTVSPTTLAFTPAALK